jgi:hypothetical protein
MNHSNGELESLDAILSLYLKLDREDSLTHHLVGHHNNAASVGVKYTHRVGRPKLRYELPSALEGSTWT